MTQITRNKTALCVFVLLLVSAVSCSNLQSFFNEEAYRQAVSLKVESLDLMDKATENYAKHEEAIYQLNIRLQKAYEYARGRPKNETSARQWDILIDPERNLLGGFLSRWQQKGSFSRVFVNENKRLVADAFDTIIELESGKLKASEVE